MTERNPMKDAILGLAVGDALGVPVEFTRGPELKLDPVTGMRAFGTHNQQAGTWSDDTSLTLALLDSLAACGEFNAEDAMGRFAQWYKNAEYCPRGKVFDVGNTTSKAINRFISGAPALECGDTSEHGNGNGALMRIMPMALFLKDQSDKNSAGGKPAGLGPEAFEPLSQAVKLTHAHPRNQAACWLYANVASGLVDGLDKFRTVEIGVQALLAVCGAGQVCEAEKSYFSRLNNLEDFAKLPESEMRSGGYVMETIEAALWCLLTTDTYADCVLKAVNMGWDTDTTATVAGGLAGLLYGEQAIPAAWLAVLARREWILELCEKYRRIIAENS